RITLTEGHFASTIFRAVRDVEMGDLVVDLDDKRNGVLVGADIMSNIQVASEVRGHREDFLNALGGANLVRIGEIRVVVVCDRVLMLLGKGHKFLGDAD